MGDDPIADWLRWMRAAGTPSTTAELRRHYLTRLQTAVTPRPLLELDVDDLEAWTGSHDWAPNTRKCARSSLRSFYGWARERGLVDVSPAHQLPAVRVPRGRPKPIPEPVYRAALAAADDRVRLAIMLAAQCGLRRGEIARLHSRDLEEDLVGSTLRIVGKGGHTRVVPLPAVLAEQLLEHPPGWVFPSPRGGHLTPHHLAKLIKAALERGSTHGLRHRAATVAYAGTRDLRAVQELLGHSRPETTAGYIQVPDDAVRAAMMAAAA